MAEQIVGGFGVIKVLRRSVVVFADNAAAFIGLTMVLQSPVFMNDLVMGNSLEDAEAGTSGMVGLVLLVVAMLLSSMLLVYIISGTIRVLRGQRPRFRDCLGQGVPHLLFVIAVGMSYGVFLILPVITAGLAAGILAGELLPSAWDSDFAVYLFVLPLMAPCAYFFVVLAVVLPVAVIERPRFRDCFNRSADLTRHRRWSVLAVVIAASVGLYVVELMVPAVGEGLMALSTVIAFAVSSATTAFTLVVTAVLYHDLRITHDDVATDVAQVFE